jgi:hypothetical protein
MARRLQILGSRYAARAIALLTALVVFAGAIGIPVPRPAKDAGEPFPCMHNACGCASAEACWQGCCCMTHEQKLAWAKKHDVTPPAGIVEVPRNPGQQGGSCCQSEQCDDAGPDSAGSLALRFIRLEDYRKCQGHSSLWLVLSQALPPQMHASFQRELTLVAWCRPAATAQVASPAFDPATPPPRAAL